MTLHVFDFDGVLFDTARECLAIAYTAACKVPGLAAESWRAHAAPPTDVAEAFLAHRHWVGPPWQYAVLLECIARGKMPQTTVEFLALAASRKASHESFTEVYFATRGELSCDVERWCAVIEAYPAVDVFRRLHAAGTAAILSTRDDASISKILAHVAGISNVRLLPRSGPREKWELLVDVAERLGLPRRRVFFLDDYAHHALPAHRAGFAAHLALWGYLGPGDHATARAAGLPCLQLADLEPALSRHEQEDAS